MPDSIPPGCPQSCEPFIVSCEPGPEEPAEFGGSVGCDVIEDCVPCVPAELRAHRAAVRAEWLRPVN